MPLVFLYLQTGTEGSSPVLVVLVTMKIWNPCMSAQGGVASIRAHNLLCVEGLDVSVRRVVNVY